MQTCTSHKYGNCCACPGDVIFVNYNKINSQHRDDQYGKDFAKYKIRFMYIRGNCYVQEILFM